MEDVGNTNPEICPIPITVTSPQVPEGDRWVLYEGDLRLSVGKQVAAGRGVVAFSLSGSPQVTFNVDLQPGISIEFGEDFDNCLVDIPQGAVSLPAVVFSSNQTLGSNGPVLAHAGGVFEGSACSSILKIDGTPEPLGRVQFYLLNFPPYRGTPLFTGMGSFWQRWLGRATFCFGKWEVILDQFPQADGRFGEAVTRRGHVVNHVGVLRRGDGKLFSSDEAIAALEFLYWLFTFCAGYRCPTLLPQGLRHLGYPLWQQWGVQKADHARRVGSWFNEFCPNICFQVANGLYALWSDADKRKWLSLAIGIYVAANYNSGAIELALSNSQIILELLTWVALTEENSMMSEAGFAGLSAADKVRALLFWLGVPASIPERLDELRAAQPNVDAPQATTGIRNRIIHPTRSNRAERAALSNRAVYQAWQWNLWVAELTLLMLCGYIGAYRSRASDEPAGRAWDLVPWHPNRRT